ncbi:MAG TPA: hypothetical protein VG479_01565 [Gaiellaceae bacterium]|jgi:hypothetical protein|nr:hypothetical protein [Gaiellaceae bacterium]
MPGTLGALASGEAVVAAGISLAIGLPLVLLGPPPGDLPAHLYRTELARDGVLVWDTFWYAGHYPFVGYSLLYYFPAALLGNDVLALLAVVAASALFATLAVREWGDRARWATRAFAVAACGPLFTGTYPYAVALATSLGAVLAVQSRRRWTAVALSALTAGLSPLAFLFLCLVALAVFLARGRRADRTALVVGGGLVVLGALQGALLLLYRNDSEYPFFRFSELVAVLALSAACAALALRGENGRTLATLFGLWALAAVVAFVVPSPIGENVTRLRGIVLPLALLAAAIASYRPRWLTGIALAGALAFTLVPYVGGAAHRTDTRSSSASFWQPALDVLAARWSPDYRVEVVPTGDHWESYYVPRAGFPLARGWYRQLDIASNSLFYEAPLEPAEYRAWLESLGIRYVLLPHTQLGRIGEEREADLLSSGRSGLLEIARAGDVTVYELPDPRPILTGPARARITAMAHDRVAGEVAAPGAYRLAVRWTPTWRVRAGDVCVEEAPDGMTSVVAERAGPFELGVSALPLPPGCG